VQAVIDPGGPHEFPVPAQGGPGEFVPAGTRIFVGDPAEEPGDVLEALRAVFREEEAVRAAYRAQVYVEAPGERPHIAIGVLLEGQAREESLFARASQAARAVRDDLPLSFLVIEADAPNAVTAHMLGESSPFYVAET
jgi:hypothetical protein